MATTTASAFASVLIFVVPFGCSEFLSEPEVGYEHEFAEIMVADSKNFLFLDFRYNFESADEISANAMVSRSEMSTESFFES